MKVFHLYYIDLKIFHENKMSNYGQVIGRFNIQKENIYEMMVEYFGDLEMTKMKDQEAHSIYMAKINSMLKNGNRYVIIIVNRDSNELDNKVPLSSLRWVCFQTRTLSDFHNIPKQSYTIKRNDIYNSKIRVNKRSTKETEYDSEMYSSILITLLHSKGIEYEYPNEGTIQAALETFQTIVTFK